MSVIIKFQCFERMIIAKEEKIRRDKLHRRIISKKKKKKGDQYLHKINMSNDEPKDYTMKLHSNEITKQ